MKRASKDLINEITDLLKQGMTQIQIAEELDKQGKLTPNGTKFSHINVAYYIKAHKPNKKNNPRFFIKCKGVLVFEGDYARIIK
jgi:hypothetical protein